MELDVVRRKEYRVVYTTGGEPSLSMNFEEAQRLYDQFPDETAIEEHEVIITTVRGPWSTL